MGEFWQTLKQAGKEFGADKAPRLAAALAYYTVFSIAPLLIILIAVVGLVYGTDEARSQLTLQLEEQVGDDTASLIATMVENTAERGSGVLAAIIGVVTLLVGATRVFVQLQAAMNEIWDVPEGQRGGIGAMLMARLQGLGLVLVFGLLLLLSFTLQAALNVIMSNFAGLLPGGELIWYLANQVLTLALLAVAFAALFRVLPDVDVGWRDVWGGALLTAVLFKIGEVLLGLFLGFSGVQSAYGAAGSLVVLLLWIYYSAQIMLFGAEFTHVHARRRGSASAAPANP